MAVLLLGVAAAFALLVWHESAAVERGKAEARDRGRLLAMWLRVAHDATMVTDYRPALAGDPDGFEVTPGSLAGVPAGLPVPPGLRVGVMDDGAGVPMAWCVLGVDDFSRGPARLGGLDGGLAAVGVAGAAGSPMADREAGVAAALGSPVGPGNLFATADRGFAFEEEAVHRRAQPGRPWASRMDAELDLGGNDAVNGGNVDANSVVTSGAVESRTVASVAGGVGGATASLGSMGAEGVSGDALRVNGGVETPVLEVAGAARAGTVAVTGRVEAGSFRTIGQVDAGLLVVGGRLEGIATLTLSGGVDAREFSVGTSFVSSGSAAARVVGAGTMTANGLNGPTIALGGDVFGPSARITGTLTVGSCNGC